MNICIGNLNSQNPEKQQSELLKISRVSCDIFILQQNNQQAATYTKFLPAFIYQHFKVSLIS